ncbi:MAG TPA: oligopeptide/dipeptide ABC transporter ATP-binding protein, partial [Candidatus Dormibacteraeota bacterium]|nr:oligopeptide/dipeptide ABC transporter ATP-binding protein [Candidatus Dormibacteraeota bacterium]
HELSGGQRCRASLAMAMVLDPAVLVLDEPTQGLDSSTSVEVVEAIRTAVARRGLALVVITHDLGVAARLTTRMVVLYAGRVVEDGATSPLLGTPMHPYTSALVAAFPVMTTTRDLRPIRGLPADARAMPAGCAYHPRCTQAIDVCRTEMPSLAGVDGRLVSCHLGGLRTLLDGRDLCKTFGSGPGAVGALSDASIAIREGESVGLVGPSGSGKSTLARIITGHLVPDRGSVTLEGAPLVTDGHRASGGRNRSIQLVMQDPWDALSPRLTVAELVREPLDIDGALTRDERDGRVAQTLESVGLPRRGAFLESRAHQLSGGQLQRVALARALVAQPKLLVADEPTSMLDPSEQARLLLALRERQVEMGLGLLLVSHDIALVRKVCDRIVVLDRGRIVEEGPSNVVSTAPRSVTGRRLVEAAPSFAPGSA